MGPEYDLRGGGPGKYYVRHGPDRGATGVTVEGTAQAGGTIARVEQHPLGR